MKRLAMMTAMLPLARAALAEEGVYYYTEYGESEPQMILGVPAMALLVVVIIALIAAFLTVAHLKSQLKTARSKYGAEDYVRSGSFHLSVSQDHFLYETTQRRRVANSTQQNQAPSRKG